MKIYNKKRLISGLLLLVITTIVIIAEIISMKSGDINLILNIKNIGISSLTLFSSLGLIIISLDKSANNEADIEKSDERNQSINLHVNKTVNNIMTYMYWILMIIFIIIWYNFKTDLLLIPVIILGLLISINFICNIIAYFYYEKKM